MNKYITYTPEGKILLPNIKNIFIPDDGYEICDADLSGADIQIVAADSECKWLLDYFSKEQNKKVYAQVASEFFQKDIPDNGEEYKKFKCIFHGLNYLLGLEKLSLMAGIPYNLAKELKTFYFKLNPEILKWHKRIEQDVKKTGFTRNVFGRRMQFFFSKDNPNTMNEIAASIPSSTIADTINRAWINIVENLPDINVLMQTHDSLTMQYPIELAEKYRKEILHLMLVPIPYKPILYIKSDIKVSTVSYGDCRKLNF